MLERLIELIPPSVYIGIALGIIAGIAVHKWSKKKVSVFVRILMRVTSEIQEITDDNVDRYLAIVEKWCKKWLTENDYKTVKAQLMLLGKLRTKRKQASL